MRRELFVLWGLAAMFLLGCGVAAPGTDEAGFNAQLLGSGAGGGAAASVDLSCGLPVGGGMPTPFVAVADAELEQALPTTNEGTLDYCQTKGGSNQRHCLVRWDTSSIPFTKVVKTACLQLTIDDPSGSIYPAYELLKPWTETLATWQIAQTGSVWQLPGAWGAQDSGTVQVAKIPANTGSTTVTIPFDTALAQKWVSNPTSVYGIVFGNNSSNDGLSFATRERSGNEPRLVIITTN